MNFTKLYPSSSKTETWVCTGAIGVLVAVIVGYALAMYCFVPRGSEIDELGLFNPVYMKLHYGRMTYPIYGYFQSMFVHPPVRYAEVAALMGMGMTLPYAEQFIPCLLTICIALSIAFSKFESLSKLSLLFGFYAGLVWMGTLDDRLYTLRPDTQLALAWFLGLVLLQDGFVRGWNLPRLFLGSLVLTYASGIHYFGVVAFLGVVPYLVKAYRNLPEKRFRHVAAALVAGGCVFGLPYLILFVIPDLYNIIQFSRAVQSAGGWLAPIAKHYAQYDYWQPSVRFNARTLPINGLLVPALYFRIPLFLAGFLLLMLKRDLRGLAVASLPLTLFVFAYSQGKSAGYYLPEIMLYFCGAAIGVCLVLRLVTKQLGTAVANSGIALLFVTTACWATGAGYSQYATALALRAPLIAPMEIARACAKQLVGPNAFIGGRIGLWYISGAEHWHNIEQDLLWRADISDISLPQYFASLDYVVEHNHMSNTTLNSSLESLPSWYVSGLLKLHGFVFNDQRDNMNTLIFDTAGASKLAGYIVDHQTVSRFDEDAEGDFVFGSRVCQFESWPPVNQFALPHFNAIYLPKKSAQDPSRSFLPAAVVGDSQSAVVTFVMPRQAFETQREAVDKACRPLNTVRGSLREVDLTKLLAQSRSQEQTMQFYSSIDDRVVPELDAETVPLRSFDLDHLVLAYDKAKIDGDRVKRVTTSRQAYSFAAAVEIPPDPLPEPAWIAIRQRITKGQIGMGVLDKNTNEFVTRRFVDREDHSQTVYLPLKSSGGPKTLIIENGNPGGSSTVEIEDLRVVHATKTRSGLANQVK